MNSRTTERFRESFARLPEPARQQARSAYRRFRENPHHPGLQFKRVHESEPIWAVRVGLHYRAVGYVDGETIVWFWIGSHAEYDLLLTRL
ncbi:MAG: hypothetical protein HYU66_28795 [Armatimonadetes bacterium]|nr:hypothetical protein [Armatimonadota bacterium]